MPDPGRRGDEGLTEGQRASRETGGDAPAAGSINEREEVAKGDGPFSDDGEEDADAAGEQDTAGEEAARSGRAEDHDASGDDPEGGAPGQDREGGQEAAEPPDEPPG